MKKRSMVAGVMVVLSLTACSSGVSSQEYESVSAEASQLSQEVVTFKDQKTALESERNALNSQLESMSAEYQAYKETMEPYEGLAVAEADAKKVEFESKVAAASIATEESKAAEAESIAAAEAESIAAREAEEAKGYETGITYDQLARTPDEYTGKKIKFKGKVIQVVEGDKLIKIRLAVDSDYDQILLCEYDTSIVSSRILEDDNITVYGLSTGITSYQSTMGGTITIPSALIVKIDQ